MSQERNDNLPIINENVKIVSYNKVLILENV